MPLFLDVGQGTEDHVCPLFTSRCRWALLGLVRLNSNSFFCFNVHAWSCKGSDRAALFVGIDPTPNKRIGVDSPFVFAPSFEKEMMMSLSMVLVVDDREGEDKGSVADLGFSFEGGTC